MTYSIAIVAEDHGGASLVRELCDRTLLRQDWIAGHEGDLTPFRSYLPSEEPGDHFHPKLAKDVRVAGRFDGETGASDAASFRRVFAWLALHHRPEAVLVARDSDGDEARRTGLAQARRTTGLRVAVALMVPESEAWRVALVDRSSHLPDLEELRRTLGFDPVTEPHRLSSAPTSKREAKAVAKRLYGDVPPSVDDHALDVLATQEGCGAAEFLRELRTAVVEPILGTHHP